ncbi:MAG: phospholipid carrier-dependent glycosyltransferase, partial [bacterium]|nr:phospholipid carrier-dependent glycosyltransferase [bacterium]
MKNKIILVIIILIGSILRLYDLPQNPPGFYSDEASFAYNAFSILKTGRDEYGVWLPLSAEAFGDYKLPVLLYSIVFSFLVLGDSEFTARLPGAIYGILTIPAIYFFTKELIYNKTKEEEKNTYTLPLLTAFILSLTPAHIFVSRGTWELTPALFFIVLGTTLFLKFIKLLSNHATNKRMNLYLICSTICFVLSMYSYNSARVFVPLFIVSIIGLYFKLLFTNLTQNRIVIYLAVLVVAFILCLPILQSLSSPEVTQRAKYISIFHNKGVEARLHEAFTIDIGSSPTFTRFLHNKPLFYSMDFLRRYLSHFDLNYLFITGDTFEIFKISKTGILSLASLPFLFLGLYYML